MVGQPTHNGAQEIFASYVCEEEYACQREVSIRTCQRDRAMRQASPHVMIGRSVFCRVKAVRGWSEAQEQRFEADCNKPILVTRRVIK
jgi:hypothetical protein